MRALFPDEESPCNRRKLFRFCKIACLLLCPPDELERLAPHFQRVPLLFRDILLAHILGPTEPAG